MNIFIYDNFLSEKKYNKVLSKIETRITDLGLNGKIIRLNLLKNAYDSIDGEIKRGAKTLIAVGNNLTINKVINAVCKSNFSSAENVPISIIPVGKENNEISKAVGIEDYLKACEILSSRRITDLNTVKINNDYFLSEASIDTNGTKVEIDNNYTIEIIEKGKIVVNNLCLDINYLEKSSNFSPNDNKIELLIKSKKDRVTKSVFIFDEIIINNNINKVILDRSREIETPVKISLGEKKIKLIVGKNRGF